MNNVVVMRLLMTAVIMIATIIGFLGFYFLKFPENAVVAFFAVALGVSVPILLSRKEKSERFKIYYQTVEELGSPINFGNRDAAFERAGTRFDVEFPKGEHQQFFKVNFRIPNIRQKFSIQNRSLATSFHDDCQVIQESPLPPDYLVQADNPAFLLNFLQNRQILDEILNYKATFWGRILIALDHGDVEIVWTPPLSEQIDGFYQICRSAAVFHDELKRISEKN